MFGQVGTDGACGRSFWLEIPSTSLETRPMTAAPNAAETVMMAQTEKITSPVRNAIRSERRKRTAETMETTEHLLENAMTEPPSDEF